MKKKYAKLLTLILFIISVNASKAQTTTPAEKSMWDLLHYFETTSSSQSGIASDGDFIYTSSFSSDLFRKFEMDGTFIEEFSISGITSMSCLTYDGTYFYGAKGPKENGISIMDLENHSLIGIIPISAPSIIGIGHITYDPSLNANMGGFWIGYWHELCAVDMQGNELIPNVVTGMPGIAGTGLDTVSDPENPGLICFQQTGGSNQELTKFFFNTQSFSEVLHTTVEVPQPSGGSTNAVASGLNTYINSDGKLILLGLVDEFPGNEMVFEYELGNSENYQNDIGAYLLNAPQSGSSLSSEEVINIKLHNNGSQAQSGFTIQYSIDDGTGAIGPFTQTVSETIAPNQYYDFEFDQTADLSMAGINYTITILTLLTGDENSTNDTLIKVVSNTNGNYCYASGSSSTSQEYIAKVEMAGISNSSLADNYADYSSNPDLYIFLSPTDTKELKITLNNPYNADIAAVWIDWNNDGDFDDSDENVFISPMGQGPYITSITPSTNAVENTPLRMRIRLDYNNLSPNPCGTTSFGEVEDYAIIVSEVQLNPPLNLEEDISGGQLHLTWESPSKNLLSYNIYHSLNMGDFTLLDSVDSNFTNYDCDVPQEGIHQYYVTAVYNEGESVASNIVEVLISNVSEDHNSLFEIYPNPAHKSFFVRSAYKIKHIEIFNSTGECVLDKIVNARHKQVNIEDKSPGLYIVKIITSKQIVKRLLIVK